MKIKITVPKGNIRELETKEVPAPKGCESASPEYIANEVMKNYHAHGLYTNLKVAESLWVMLVTINNTEYVGRYYTAGIGRKGGVRPYNYCNSIEEIERRLKLPSGILSADGYIGEEDYKPNR